MFLNVFFAFRWVAHIDKITGQKKILKYFLIFLVNIKYYLSLHLLNGKYSSLAQLVRASDC